MANTLLGVLALVFLIHGRLLLADGDLTGFCKERISATAEVRATNFVKVEYRSKEVPDQSTRFVHNTCQPANKRTVGHLSVQCNNTGQPNHHQFNATIQCYVTVNKTTDGAEIIFTSARATKHVNINLDSGQCPSVANVSAVQSGLSFNVSVEVEKPNCSGWEDVVSYNFTIVCFTNCTSGFRDNGSSSFPKLTFPDVRAGVFAVSVIAENSCGEQTVLDQQNISVRFEEEGKDSSAGHNLTRIIAIVVAVAGFLALLVCGIGAGGGAYLVKRRRRKA